VIRRGAAAILFRNASSLGGRDKPGHDDLNFGSEG
jgi:hypothetical protein